MRPCWPPPAARGTGRLLRGSIVLGDADALPRRSTGSPVADALEALACAARAWLLRSGPRGSPWELAVALTGGRLLHGDAPDPPGCRCYA